jgi:hypothetical protein
MENHQALTKPDREPQMVRQLSKKKAKTQKKLEKIYAENEEACEWSVGRISVAVLGQLYR